MKSLFSTVLATIALLTLPFQSAEAATYYFHNDHLGTPQVVTDENQVVVWQGEYNPFGEVIESVNDITQNLRFPGQYYDRETGLHYNYFRDYDGSLGRYLESDPIGLKGGLGTFEYVGSSPIVYFDYFGLNKNTVSFGQGYSGRVDKFNYNGATSFEIHVYDKSGAEVGIYGPSGWINKHGHNGRPNNLPLEVENQCKGQAVSLGRQMGLIPNKGQADLSKNKWMKFFRSLPLIGPAFEFTSPSPTRVPEHTPISPYM